MNVEFKIELKFKQIEMATRRLEQYKFKGWASMIKQCEENIAKLEEEIEQLEEQN